MLVMTMTTATTTVTNRKNKVRGEGRRGGGGSPQKESVCEKKCERMIRQYRIKHNLLEIMMIYLIMKNNR